MGFGEVYNYEVLGPLGRQAHTFPQCLASTTRGFSRQPLRLPGHSLVSGESTLRNLPDGVPDRRAEQSISHGLEAVRVVGHVSGGVLSYWQLLTPSHFSDVGQPIRVSTRHSRTGFAQSHQFEKSLDHSKGLTNAS